VSSTAARARRRPLRFAVTAAGLFAVVFTAVQVWRGVWTVPRPTLVGWVIALCVGLLLVAAGTFIADRQDRARTVALYEEMENVTDHADGVAEQLHARMDEVVSAVQGLAALIGQPLPTSDETDTDQFETVRPALPPVPKTAEAPAVDIVGGARLVDEDGFEWREIGGRRYRFRTAS
jgi:hypothetical protein